MNTILEEFYNAVGMSKLVNISTYNHLDKLK